MVGKTAVAIMFLSITRKTNFRYALRFASNPSLCQRKHCYSQGLFRSESLLAKNYFVRKYTKENLSDLQGHRCVLYSVRKMTFLED